MEGQHSDHHNANSFAQNELDQSTSTTTLVRGNTPQKPLRPVVQHYLKALIKITRQETKAAHHLGTLKKALEDERNPKGLTPSIKHNISKAPPHLVIQWNSILHETGEKLTKVLVDYWNDQKLVQGLEFKRPAPENLLVKIQDPDMPNDDEEPKTPVLEISDKDIISILEECEAQTMALTQQVRTGGAGQQYITKQVVQQKKMLSKSSNFPQLHNLW